LKENWKFVHLGTRVLRLEMAVVSAIAIAADALNLWTGGTGLSLSDLCD
jgi:16S rRNA U1498 N3-methylase RsmE